LAAVGTTIGDFATEAARAGTDADVLATRFERRWPIAERALRAVYGDDVAALIGQRAITQLVDASIARRPELHSLDHRRDADPLWFQHQRMIGYVAYTNRFAGRLDAVAERAPYLRELGVTYLHLMPLLRPRPGDSDGGYAVMDYDAVDPQLGTMADLESLATTLRDQRISLCVDVVMNHTAQEHAWAVAARRGDTSKRAYYHLFPDRTLPDQYEQTLREVFPDFAPGNFTALGDEWVWTTFNEFQWDLDYSNPDVFLEMLGVMLRLANRGVEILRLDAAPFIWKRMGTDCENQPEVHHLLTAYRALTAVVAPALLLKAEAIVPREQLVPYLGTALAPGDPERTECNLAYHNQLMVLLWSSLATNDGRLMSNALTGMGDIPHDSTWVTYIRCHDDIGWAITGDDAASVGWNQFAHRDFLNAFYSGEFAMSFARGAKFQENDETGDARISGMTASLCGVEDAIDRSDDAALDAALARLEMLYAITYAYGGIPLIYMGDEIALRNDRRFAANPAHADDNRWLHRPLMDWDAAARRTVAASLEGRVFAIFRRLAGARASLPELRGGASVRMLQQGDDRLFAFVRRHRREAPIWVVANFGDRTMVVNQKALWAHDQMPNRCVIASAGVEMTGPNVTLPPHGWAWLLH
jgi:amylosucrase